MGDTPQDLLEAICLAPDDDALRERYANLVEGADPAHAELIRLQLARFTRERAEGIVSSGAEGREAGLISEHGARWSRYFASFVEEGALQGSKQLTFVRGFIGHAALSLANVVGLGERLYAFAPIQHLDVLTSDGDIERLFAVPGLERLDSLSLYRVGMGDDGARALAACTALTRATWLDLGNNGITSDGALALAASPMMQNKVEVSFDANPCDPVEKPYFDYDGTLVDVAAKYPPSELEKVVGHRVRWLHYEEGNGRRKPDRFHARYVVR